MSPTEKKEGLQKVRIMITRFTISGCHAIDEMTAGCCGRAMISFLFRISQTMVYPFVEAVDKICCTCPFHAMARIWSILDDRGPGL